MKVRGSFHTGSKVCRQTSVLDLLLSSGSSSLWRQNKGKTACSSNASKHAQAPRYNQNVHEYLESYNSGTCTLCIKTPLSCDFSVTAYPVFISHYNRECKTTRCVTPWPEHAHTKQYTILRRCTHCIASIRLEDKKEKNSSSVTRQQTDLPAHQDQQQICPRLSALQLARNRDRPRFSSCSSGIR